MFKSRGYSLLLILCLNSVLTGNQVLYEAGVENGTLTDQNTFEFDVFIKSTSGSFSLTSYQCALTFHSKINNGGTLTFSYIAGSSELSNIPSSCIGIYNENSVDRLTFASLPGNDIIGLTGKRIGRFKLENTNAFGPFLAEVIDLNWNFDSAAATILTGTGFLNITEPSYHTILTGGFKKLSVVSSVSSDTMNSQVHPGKSIDGYGYFDEDQLSYWAAEPVPQSIKYDLGSVKAVSLTRFSFYEFGSGRKYIYSVQLSGDNITWRDVVVCDTSENIEYMENLFETQNARYVKLLLISNDQNEESSIWEAEIWGNNDALMPVELKNFSIAFEQKSIELKWETITEVNNYGFEIQRSSDISEWQLLGFIDGHGNSNIPRYYSFRDSELLNSGKYYYRLKQVDTDGKFEYSRVLDIEISNSVNEYSLMQNYPNPFNPDTEIKFFLKEKDLVTLSVYNILGEKISELINKELGEGWHYINFNGTYLSSGIYIYILIVKNKYSGVKKMTLLK